VSKIIKDGLSALGWLTTLLPLFVIVILLPTPNVEALSIRISPLFLGLLIHLACYRLRLPAPFGILAAAPQIVAYHWSQQQLDAYAKSLEGCMSPWCDQEPMVIMLNETLILFSTACALLVLTGVGCNLWLRRQQAVSANAESA
jgi:hypothetical protein